MLINQCTSLPTYDEKFEKPTQQKFLWLPVSVDILIYHKITEILCDWPNIYFDYGYFKHWWIRGDFIILYIWRSFPERYMKLHPVFQNITSTFLILNVRIWEKLLGIDLHKLFVWFCWYYTYVVSKDIGPSEMPFCILH